MSEGRIKGKKRCLTMYVVQLVMLSLIVQSANSWVCRTAAWKSLSVFFEVFFFFFLNYICSLLMCNYHEEMYNARVSKCSYVASPPMPFRSS